READVVDGLLGHGGDARLDLALRQEKALGRPTVERLGVVADGLVAPLRDIGQDRLDGRAHLRARLGLRLLAASGLERADHAAAPARDPSSKAIRRAISERSGGLC